MNLTVIDVSGWIYRHFYGSPAMTRSDGMPTGAVHGCTQALWNILRPNPHHVCAVFDHGKKTWRNDLYEDYKAHRPPTPELLAPQFPYIHTAIDAFDVVKLSAEGYEADDVIATLARKAHAADLDVTIVSSDKDLMQLITEGDDVPGIRLHDPLSHGMIGPEQVLKKFGVRPGQMGDLLALMGDPADNVPGVPLCGQKTAAKLLAAFGSLDAVLNAAQETELVPPLTKAVRSNLSLFKGEAVLSRQLVELKFDAPVSLDLDSLRVTRPNSQKVSDFLDEMEFVTLRQDIFAQAA